VEHCKTVIDCTPCLNVWLSPAAPARVSAIRWNAMLTWFSELYPNKCSYLLHVVQHVEPAMLALPWWGLLQSVLMHAWCNTSYNKTQAVAQTPCFAKHYTLSNMLKLKQLGPNCFKLGDLSVGPIQAWSIDRTCSGCGQAHGPCLSVCDRLLTTGPAVLQLTIHDTTPLH
jgi:hypothetical protein